MRSASIALAICSVPAPAVAQANAEPCYDTAECSTGGRSRASRSAAAPISEGLAGVQLPVASSSPEKEALISTARKIVAMRGRRDRHFRGELFAEPAWDMMLDLFIAHLEGRRIYVTSLCIASNVPNTTALRYIQDMVRHGEIVSCSDAKDGRRRWLSLSESAVVAMSQIVMGTATAKA